MSSKCTACAKNFGLFTKAKACEACGQPHCEKCLGPGLGLTACCNACIAIGPSAISRAPPPQQQQMTAEETQLNQRLQVMFDEQELPQKARDTITLLPSGKKYELLAQFENSRGAQKTEATQPSFWVGKLQNMSDPLWKESDKTKSFLNTVKSQGRSWMIQFIQLGGLKCILTNVHVCRIEEVRSVVFKALSTIVMTQPGLLELIKLSQTILPLVLSSLAPATSNESRYEIFDLLAFTCSAMDEGHQLVQTTLIMPEISRTPYKALVDLFFNPHVSAAVHYKLLMLINALINISDTIEDRQRQRQLLRSAGFPNALDYLRNATSAATALSSPIPPSKIITVTSPSLNRLSTIDQPPPMNRMSTVDNSGRSAHIATSDQSQVWENIRVQLDLYECAEEEDAIDATRNGIDFGSLSDLLEYIRVHMQPSVGHFLLPLLQMICIMPFDNNIIWSEVLRAVKFIISGSKTDELLIKDELFTLADRLAQGIYHQYSMAPSADNSAGWSIERQHLEQQLNTLRDHIRHLESTTPSVAGSEELMHLRADNALLKQQLAAAAASSGDSASLDRIKALEAEVAQLRAALASGGANAVASGPTTVIIQTPEPPCLAGFTPVPHQPRTVVIEGGAVLPPGAGAGVAPAVAPSNIPQPPCLPGFNAVAVTAPAGSVPSNGSPQPPVLAGFNPVGGAVGAAVPTAPAGGAACQADGKPWPPVLPGFKAQPGAPAAASSASAPTNTSASTPAAPPKPAEPEIKLPYKRQPIKPSTKMRNLHWAKLEDKVIENTIWNTLNDQRNIKLDAKDLEAVFCQQNKAAGPSSPIAEEAAAKTPAKATQITFIDGQRGQNMAIAISRFKPLTFEQMRDAILHMDFKAMSVDTAVALSKWLPTPEEVETVSSYEGPIADLQQTDRYVLIVGKVPAMDRRVEAFIFRCQFETTYDELKRKIEQCTAVLQRISSSKAIVRTLEYILALGNYLNGGTKKGDAYGFEIAFITRLQDTRSVDNKTNLLQYLLPILDKDPITATLQEAFVGIEEVARIDIAQLVGDVSKFNGSFNKIKGLITQLTKSAPAGCKFVTVMEPFVQSGEPKAKSLTTALQTITELSAGLAKSYGEETNKFGPSDVFKLYNDFNKQLTSVRQELKRQEELRLKQEKLAATAKAKAASPPPARSLAPPAAVGSDENDEQQMLQIKNTLSGNNPSDIMANIKMRREARQFGTLGKK